jgi:hypothetical protein
MTAVPSSQVAHCLRVASSACLSGRDTVARVAKRGRSLVESSCMVDPKTEALVFQFWKSALLSDLGTDSLLVAKLADLSDVECNAVIRAAFYGEASTLSRHIGVWKKWRTFCSSNGVACGNPGHTVLLQFLLQVSLSSKSARASLRFAASRSECAVLLGMLEQPAVKGRTLSNAPGL